MDEAAARDYLMKNDDRFRELVEEHQQYERKLESFVHRPFLSSQEQMEETVIKKKKLALKDRMQLLIQQCQSQDSVNGR